MSKEKNLRDIAMDWVRGSWDGRSSNATLLSYGMYECEAVADQAAFFMPDVLKEAGLQNLRTLAELAVYFPTRVEKATVRLTMHTRLAQPPRWQDEFRHLLSVASGGLLSVMRVVWDDDQANSESCRRAWERLCSSERLHPCSKNVEALGSVSSRSGVYSPCRRQHSCSSLTMRGVVI